MACCQRRKRAGARNVRVSTAAEFEQVYLDNEAALYRYLARRLDSSHAEDAVAEVFAIAWQRFPTRDRATTARTWLLGLALERLKMRRDDELACLRQLACRDHGGGPSFAQPHVARALAELDPVDRDMLTLHVWAEVSHETVGFLTGFTTETVHHRIDGAYEFVRRSAGAPPAAREGPGEER